MRRNPLFRMTAWLAVPLCLAMVSSAMGAPPSPPDDACRLAHTPVAESLVTLPFETVDGRIYVNAQVNGGGPYRFAVDTGASGMGRLDASLATTLALPRHGQATTSDGVSTTEVETSKVQSLALQGLVRHDLELITRDYNKRNAPEAAFHGIIGREFFADGLLVIDYPRKVLSFSRSQQLAASAAHALPYERAFRIPVSIGEHSAVGHLDTGANVSFVLPQALYDQVAVAPLQEAVRSQLTNGELETWRGTVHGPFGVGQIRLRDVEVRVSAKYPELLIGADALQQAVVLIDQRSKRVAVCR